MVFLLYLVSEPIGIWVEIVIYFIEAQVRRENLS